MFFKSFIVALAGVLAIACGVKAPPLPPLKNDLKQESAEPSKTTKKKNKNKPSNNK